MNIDEIIAHPRRAQVVEDAIISAASGTPASAVHNIALAGDDFPSTREGQRQFMQNLEVVRNRDFKTWRGFDVQHTLTHCQPVRRDGSQFDIFMMLDIGTHQLNQQTFDFLTVRDLHGYKLNVTIQKDQTFFDLLQYSEDEIHLAEAFMTQMVEEAEPSRHRVAAGMYVLHHEPLPRLDAQISYTHLRLYITSERIFVTLVDEGEKNYLPFIWQADPSSAFDTSSTFLPTRAKIAMHIMLACIWRDACVVREQWTENKKDARPYSTSKSRPSSNAVVLPRVIYKSRWGHTEERAIIERQAAHAHRVRGSYPVLREGYNPRNADERAADYGYMPPPPGCTFRKPHTRGEDEITREEARKIVSKGLRVAKILLS